MSDPKYIEEELAAQKTRTFETGANRNSDEGKLDYEGALSPLVLKRCAEYSLKHNVMEDGSIRTADNWQKGMPLGVYMESAFRHFVAWWGWHRDPLNLEGTDVEEAICGLLFNASGFLHELLKEKRREAEAVRGAEILRETPDRGFPGMGDVNPRTGRIEIPREDYVPPPGSAGFMDQD